MTAYRRENGTYHGNVKRGAQVDRSARGSVCIRGNERRNETHDAVATNGNTVTGCTVGGRQHFWSVCVCTFVLVPASI